LVDRPALRKRFRPKQKEPATGEGTVFGVFVEVGAAGKAVAIQPIRLGPVLANVG
jgi:hypothetical protein